MRILHTADWHLGRTLEGRSRLNEQADFLEELYSIVKEEKVDVVLMAGDVFDSVNPPAAAEQLFYEGVSKLTNNAQIPLIIIAGNHDSPDRLSAASPLAYTHGISLLGYPTKKIQSIHVPSIDQILNVASLPYPSESRLNEVLSDENDEELLQKAYNVRVSSLFHELSKQFNPDHVNVAMSHIFVAGGSSSDSERPIEVGGAYTVAVDSLPESAQYVALGHLHRPQTIKGKKVTARYSGSPLAYSFSESGYTKSVTIIDVEPGSEAIVNEIYVSSGKPLVKWKAEEGLQQVYKWFDEGKDQNAWIDLEISVKNALSLEEIQRLRKLHPGIIHIRPQFEEMDVERTSTHSMNLPIEELFQRFYEKQTGGAKPEDELIKLFLELIHDEEEVE